MSKTYVGNRVKSLKTAPLLVGYSKVHLDVSDTLWYEAGDNSGRTLTVNNPWGTQAMCDNILESVKGYQHQPFTANGAIIDPSVELWDGLNVGQIYGGVGSMRTRFGTLVTADISSPGENAVDHEYPYKSAPDRKIVREYRELRASLEVTADKIAAEVAARTEEAEELRGSLLVQSDAIAAEVSARKRDSEEFSSSLKMQADAITEEVSARQSDTKDIRATLKMQADQISAKVSQTGGSNKSFGWSMTATQQVWYADGAKIFQLDKDGAMVSGEIRATKGTIGGMTINNDSISSGTAKNGVSIGPSGLRLGANFYVDSAGNLTASSGIFAGAVRAGSIQYGGDNGTLNGYGIGAGTIGNSRIIPNDITTSSMNASIKSALTDAINAELFCSGQRETRLIRPESIVFNKHTLALSSTTIDGKTIKFVGWV